MQQGRMIAEEGNGRGVVAHCYAPCFRARWSTGADELETIDGPCWSDEGSGDGEDTLHIYGFQWTDPAPDQARFEALMGEAVQQIEAWINSRM